MPAFSFANSKYQIIASCTVVAILACIIQNTIKASGTTLVFDSGHYMGTVQLMCAALQAQLAHTPLVALNESAKLNAFLLLDGPLVPLVGTIVFTLLGKIPQAIDWRIFIYIEIFFQALATACLTSLAFDLSTKKHAKFLAMLTGMAWALYPAAILSTDSFLGELPATALLLLTMCLMVRTIKIYPAPSAVTSGILATASGLLIALVFMSKPALILSLALTAALWLSFVWRRSNKVICISGFCLGVALALTPWLLFTHNTSGHWHFSAYRIPIYNITRGMSCHSDGWGTVPLDPVMQSYNEDTSALSCMVSIFKELPGPSINLMLRKPERLWLLPWNNFHHKCLGVGPGVQIFLHQITLIIAAIGLILLPLGVVKRQATANFVAISAPLVILGHLTYLPFETSSRYGFSSMPMVLLLAAITINCMLNNYSRFTNKLQYIGLLFYIIAVVLITHLDLQALLQSCSIPTTGAVFIEYLLKLIIIIGSFLLGQKLAKLEQRRSRPLLYYSSMALTALLSLVVTVHFIAHFFNDKEERTWKCNLEAGQSISRNVIYKASAKTNWQILLIDCQNWGKASKSATKNDDLLAGSTISINGKELTEPSFNPISLIRTWTKLDQMQADFASLFGKTPSDLRQWRAFYIPPEYLQDNNEIKLEAGRPLTIFGDSNQLNEQPPFIPAMDYLSASKLLQEHESPDGRIVTVEFQAKQSTCLPATKELLESNDLSPALGRQSGSYRMYIVSGNHGLWQRNSLNTNSFVEVF